MKKKKWQKIDPMNFAINQNAGKVVQGDEEFAVWRLGKQQGLGNNLYADITKRDLGQGYKGYEIGVGKKFKGGYPFKRVMATNRETALKELIKEMRKYGSI